MNQKLKNRGLWISLASLAYLIVKDLGYEIDPTKWETYVSLILGILATLGIFSSPKEGKGYKDIESNK